MSSIGKRNIEELLLAIHLNTDLNIQLVTTTSYKPHLKQLTNKFSLEYLIRKKVQDEEGNNTFKYMKYKTEHFRSLADIYVHLGKLYKEKTLQAKKDDS